MKPLSRNEIKKDISDIEYNERSDTESNSSVLSEEILNSTYPVKPRRHTKPKIEQRIKQIITKDIGDIDQNIIEETVEFLRIVETARPDIFEAEKEREDIEIKYQVNLLPLLIIIIMLVVVNHSFLDLLDILNILDLI